MRPQLMRPVQDRNHGDVKHAAGLARQLLAAPHRAPAIFVQELLERLVKAVDVLKCVADISLAEHGFSDFEAFIVHFLVHERSSSLISVPTLEARPRVVDRKSTRLNSSHPSISYAVFCL